MIVLLGAVKRSVGVRWGEVIIRCGGIGYNMDVLRPTACLVVGPVGVGGFLASLDARRWVGPRAG